MLQKKVNPMLIQVLENWYLKSKTSVKWKEIFSNKVSLKSGVRQGGILSPVLFSIYVDTLLNELSASDLGCNINGKCMNSFMYADDLTIISASLYDLQIMLDKCSNIFSKLDLPVNEAKSQCLRIGQRWQEHCEMLYMNDAKIEWVIKAKFLGIYISAGKIFKCDWSNNKKKFYISLNTILGRLRSCSPYV